jgi:hypothetical protein
VEPWRLQTNGDKEREWETKMFVVVLIHQLYGHMVEQTIKNQKQQLADIL